MISYPLSAFVEFQNDIYLSCFMSILQDEEADYIFYPGDKAVDGGDEVTERIDQIDMTSNLLEADGDGGGGGEDDGGGGQENVVWELRDEDEDYDSTPVNSHSDDEKVDLRPAMEQMEEEEEKQMEASKDQNIDEINKVNCLSSFLVYILNVTMPSCSYIISEKVQNMQKKRKVSSFVHTT